MSARSTQIVIQKIVDRETSKNIVQYTRASFTVHQNKYTHYHVKTILLRNDFKVTKCLNLNSYFINFVRSA